MMNPKKFHGGLIALLAAMALSGPVAADDSEVASDPEATEGDVSVPEEAANEGRENSAYGIDQANAAREDGRAYGDTRSEAAGDNADSASAVRSSKGSSAGSANR